MLAIGFSLIVYIKVAAFSGSELLGVVATMGFFMAAFAVLSLVFNSKEKAGEEKSTWQELKELQEKTRKASEEEFAKKKDQR